MRARLQHRGRSIGIALVINGTKNGRSVSEYVAWLGDLAAPGSPEERAAFWPRLDRRLKSIAARDPRLTPAEAIKIKASIKARLPPPSGRA